MKNSLIIITLLISGCAFIEKAPSEWDDYKNISNASCVDISGVYKDEGVYFDEKLKKSKVYLSSKFKSGFKGNYEALKINFAQNGEMIVTGLNDNLSASVNFDKDSYECNGSRLRLSLSKGMSWEGTFVFEKDFIDFKFINNSLYVKETSNATFIDLPIPIVIHAQSYSKFERLRER
jgi:hypothetical protein